MAERAKKTLAYLEEHLEDMVADIERLVVAQSSSTEPENLEICVQVLKELLLERLGGEVQLYPVENGGSNLCWTPAGEKGDHIMLVGHYDTVWPKDFIPMKRDGNILYGPGVLDMKSGLVACIWAILALREQNCQPAKIMLAVNSDEELGSGRSKALFADLASNARAALVCEPGGDRVNVLKTGRKGSASYKISFKGLSTHAGIAYWDGISAIEEMARTITYLHSLANRETGTTVNVGVCGGGRKANVVADFAEIQVDTRYVSQEEHRKLHEIVMGLKPSVTGVEINCACISASPPMEENERNLAVFQVARQAGERLGLTLENQFVGGASDGNYISALGIPTLDGLGPVGIGAHALHEQLYLEFLPVRVALLSEIIAEV